jgi:ResB-like family
MNPIKLLVKVFSSFGMAVVLLILMFFIILFGTLYQVDHGLHEAQKVYFDSMIVMHRMGPVVIPLPGAYLIMVLLGINLFMGGLLRMKKNRSTLGILITHLGIVVLLVSGAITFHFADRGNMRLFEGQTSSEFSSYYDWTLEVGEFGSDEDLLVIPDTSLKDLAGRKGRTFYSDALPFEVTVSGYHKNAVPAKAGPHIAGVKRVVDGYYLRSLEPESDAEMNVPGYYITVTDKATRETTDGILWGLSQEPVTVSSGDKEWGISLSRKRWVVPFSLTLDTFVHEMHAGTDMAASYESYVTKTENGDQSKIRIWMNHPLRHKGYTFFQSSWGREPSMPGNPVFSVFSVVRNPADQGPLWACIIVGIGMLLHFGQKLLRYMKAESRRRVA